MDIFTEKTLPVVFRAWTVDFNDENQFEKNANPDKNDINPAPYFVTDELEEAMEELGFKIWVDKTRDGVAQVELVEKYPGGYEPREYTLRQGESLALNTAPAGWAVRENF